MWHLVKRFFGSVFARRLNETEKAWVFSHLSSGEQQLWGRFGKADQLHSFQVGKRAERFLEDKVTRDLMAAALMHDIGKTAVNAGTCLRVVSSLCRLVLSVEQIERWAESNGWKGRVGGYLASHELGAKMLESIDSSPLTVAWAREHELDPRLWTIPPEVGQALLLADNI